MRICCPTIGSIIIIFGWTQDTPIDNTVRARHVNLKFQEVTTVFTWSIELTKFLLGLQERWIFVIKIVHILPLFVINWMPECHYNWVVMVQLWETWETGWYVVRYTGSEGCWWCWIEGKEVIITNGISNASSRWRRGLSTFASSALHNNFCVEDYFQLSAVSGLSGFLCLVLM